FNVDAYHVSLLEIKKKAINVLNARYNNIGVYLAHQDNDSQRQVKWIGLDMTQGGIIKERFDLKEPARWTKFIQEIRHIKYHHHIGLLVQMVNPDTPTQAVTDKELRVQRVDSFTRNQRNPSQAEAPIPIVLPIPNSSQEKSQTIECRRLGTHDVTLEIPPKTPQFKTYLNGHKPAGPVYTGSTSTIPVPSQPNISTNTDERMYEAKYCGSFEDFLRFARIH
ncbi:hypothetical protein DFH28DRAFT_829624, partial [Melampsora americana]